MGALVGVGRTLCHLMPLTDGYFGYKPVLDIVADDVTVTALTIITWDHIPLTYAMHWRGAAGIWRQVFFNRVSDCNDAMINDISL